MMSHSKTWLRLLLLSSLGAGCLFAFNCGSTSGESCSCEVTINGLKKTSNTCGEKLCFGSDAHICRTGGIEFVSNGCASGSGGGTGTGGASGTGGSAGTGGQSGTGGGSTGTGGGTSGTGGGQTATGGGMTGTGGGMMEPEYTCTGLFSCGTEMCDAATQYCFDYDGLLGCEDFTSMNCSSRDQYCVNWRALSAQICQGSLRGSCTVAAVTGAVTTACR